MSWIRYLKYAMSIGLAGMAILTIVLAVVTYFTVHGIGEILHFVVFGFSIIVLVASKYSPRLPWRISERHVKIMEIVGIPVMVVVMLLHALWAYIHGADVRVTEDSFTTYSAIRAGMFLGIGFCLVSLAELLRPDEDRSSE